MTDPVSVASLAITILGKTTDALNALRERSQRSKDVDIKDQINTLYDNVLQLKEVISRLLDENKEQKRQLDELKHPPEVPTLKQVGETQYYFKGDSDVAYCQPCYDDKGKLIAVAQPYHSKSGGVSRRCLVCNHTFYEKQVNF